jgi:toxin ParE1/3/4
VKPAVLRPQAEIDLLDVTGWYGERGGEALAERFFDGARATVRTIERTPALGSLRLGLLAGIEGLRSWPVDPFPVRWVYFERPDFVDIVRLLGEREDITAILGAGID